MSEKETLEKVDLEKEKLKKEPSEILEKKKTKKKRCTFCNKRLGMIHFDCECGGNFCSIHRYTHTHNCKSIGVKHEKNKNIINNNNPIIQFQKFTKV